MSVEERISKCVRSQPPSAFFSVLIFAQQPYS